MQHNMEINRIKRTMNESELLYAEDAFTEYVETGKTDRKCPWCGEDFIFVVASTAHAVKCTQCEFKYTARGI